jgi:hypothetical protein
VCGSNQAFHAVVPSHYWHELKCSLLFVQTLLSLLRTVKSMNITAVAGQFIDYLRNLYKIQRLLKIK